jgi:hypothetical protein
MWEKCKYAEARTSFAFNTRAFLQRSGVSLETPTMRLSALSLYILITNSIREPAEKVRENFQRGRDCQIF